jgi:hypothetical protein
MCECITTIQNKVIADQPFKDKVVVSAEIDSTFVIIDNEDSSDMDQQTYSKMEVVIEGKKKPQTMNLNHNYCPFCGEKYKKSSSANTELTDFEKRVEAYATANNINLEAIPDESLKQFLDMGNNCTFGSDGVANTFIKRGLDLLISKAATA